MNYCSAADAATMTGRPETEILTWWLDAIDGLIEKHTGQGYKGEARTFTHIGSGNSLMKLPSKAQTITSITENGDALDTSEYTLESNARFIERTNLSYPYSLYGQRAGCWTRRNKYVVAYVEPTLDQAPYEDQQAYRIAAAECVAAVAMFVKKRQSYGIALSASDAGQAGRVSTAASTSFPASLIDDLRRIITGTIKKTNL